MPSKHGLQCCVEIESDRRIFDKRVRDTIKPFAQVGATVGHAERSGDLRTFTESGKKIIISPVQKFPFLLDQAHSSQGGKTSAAVSMALSEAGAREDDETTALGFRWRGPSRPARATALRPDVPVERHGFDPDLSAEDLVAWIIPKDALSSCFSRQGITKMPHKFNAARRHKFDKAQYRVIHWAEYNESLRHQGDLMIWVSDEAQSVWSAPRRTSRGGQRRYSDLAIETCLTLRTAYRLRLRQTQGLMGSIGPKLKSRSFSRQITEIQLGQKVLNTMTALGRPVFERTA